VSADASVHEGHNDSLECREAAPSNGTGIETQSAAGTSGTRDTFRYVTPPDLPVAAFCGIRARMDALEFNLKHKEPLSFGTCADAEKF